MTIARSDEQMKLYNRTAARLKRAGINDPTAQIIARAEEIEYYRGKINALEELLQKAPETEEAKE